MTVLIGIRGCMKYKAIAVEGAFWPTVLTGCQGLAGSALQDGGVPSEHWNVVGLFVIIQTHYLIMEKYDLKQKHLKSIPCRSATFKKYVDVRVYIKESLFRKNNFFSILKFTLKIYINRNMISYFSFKTNRSTAGADLLRRERVCFVMILSLTRGSKHAARLVFFKRKKIIWKINSLAKMFDIETLKCVQRVKNHQTCWKRKKTVVKSRMSSEQKGYVAQRNWPYGSWA